MNFVTMVELGESELKKMLQDSFKKSDTLKDFNITSIESVRSSTSGFTLQIRLAKPVIQNATSPEAKA